METFPPNLFDRVPRSLFGPLGDPHAELHGLVLSALFRNEFEREPFVVVRAVAVEIAERVVRDSSYWRERKAEIVALREDAGPASDPGASLTDETSQLRDVALRLVNRLKKNGWIHFAEAEHVGRLLGVT